jgi:hypothetical protein
MFALSALFVLAGGRPAQAQEAPPDTLTDATPRNGAAADQDRARVEARVRELRKELAAAEQKLAESQRQSADATKSGGDRALAAEKRANNSAREARRASDAARLAGERTEPMARERGGATMGAMQLDPVDLANSLMDASGEFKLAKITFDARDKLKGAGAFNEVELAEARARMETADKRLAIMRSLAQVALESAQASLERLEKLREQGVDSGASIEEAAGRVKMLAVIVKGAE